MSPNSATVLEISLLDSPISDPRRPRRRSHGHRKRYRVDTEKLQKRGKGIRRETRQENSQAEGSQDGPESIHCDLAER